MDQFIWILAILLAVIAGLAGFTAFIFLLRLAATATATAGVFAAGALLGLIILTVLDIRFLSLIVIIFAILADHYGGGWSWIAAILSVSLFLMSASYTIMFLTELFLLDRKILDKIGADFESETVSVSTVKHDFAEYRISWNHIHMASLFCNFVQLFPYLKRIRLVVKHLSWPSRAKRCIRRFYKLLIPNDY